MHLFILELFISITYACVGQYVRQQGNSGLELGLGLWLSMGEGGGSRRGRGGALDGTVDPVIRALQALGEHCTESCLSAQRALIL